MGDDPGARRMQAAAAIALASHALMLAMVAITRPTRLVTSSPSRDRDEVIIPIDVIEETSPPPAPAVTSVRSSAIRARPAARARATTVPRVASSEDGPIPPRLDAASEAAIEGTPGGDGANASGEGKGSAAGSGDANGTGSATAARDSLPPPLAPRAMPVPRGVFDDKSAQDSKRAISASSAVTASVIGAAETKAPQHGRGTIRIEISAGGEVTSVTSTSPSWDAVARAIAKSLAGRKLRVPAGKGVVVTFAVEADATKASNYLKGDPRVLVPCGTVDRDSVGRLDVPQPNVTCVYPGVGPRLRADVSIKLLGERNNSCTPLDGGCATIP
jgi:hypothetical protein